MNRNNIRLFEGEGKLLMFAMLVCAAYSILRVMRCDIILEHEKIYSLIPGLKLLGGYLAKDIGAGFFDNALWGGYIYVTAVVLSSILEGRYDSEHGYYFSRCGITVYNRGNIFLCLIMTVGLELIQWMIFVLYGDALKTLPYNEEDLAYFLWYAGLHLICVYMHVLITWLINILITGYLRFLIPALIITVEIYITCMYSETELWWCPVSDISYFHLESGNYLLYTFFIIVICAATGAAIYKKISMDDVL